MAVGLLLLSLLGFGALAVDLGIVRLGSSELQQTLDSAAFSGAQRFDGTQAGIDAAVATAIRVAAANPVMGQTIAVPAGNVVPGTWDPKTLVFTPWLGGDPTPVNALRINRDGLVLPAALGGAAFGRSSYDVDARSMAYRPRSAGPVSQAPCWLPVAVPSCRLDGVPAGTNPPPLKFTFNPTPSDSIAWALPDGNPNSKDILGQLQQTCGGSTLERGEHVYVNEGVHDVAIKAVANILNATSGAKPGTWDAAAYGPIPPRDGVLANTPSDSGVRGSRYGNVLEGVVPLVEGCGTSFTGKLAIEGFAWGVIYDVDDHGNGKNLWMQLDVTKSHDTWGQVDQDDDPPATNVLGAGQPQFAGW